MRMVHVGISDIFGGERWWLGAGGVRRSQLVRERDGSWGAVWRNGLGGARGEGVWRSHVRVEGGDEVRDVACCGAAVGRRGSTGRFGEGQVDAGVKIHTRVQVLRQVGGVRSLGAQGGGCLVGLGSGGVRRRLAGWLQRRGLRGSRGSGGGLAGLADDDTGGGHGGGHGSFDLVLLGRRHGVGKLFFADQTVLGEGAKGELGGADFIGRGEQGQLALLGRRGEGLVVDGAQIDSSGRGGGGGGSHIIDDGVSDSFGMIHVLLR